MAVTGTSPYNTITPPQVAVPDPIPERHRLLLPTRRDPRDSRRPPPPPPRARDPSCSDSSPRFLPSPRKDRNLATRKAAGQEPGSRFAAAAGSSFAAPTLRHLTGEDWSLSYLLFHSLPIHSFFSQTLTLEFLKVAAAASPPDPRRKKNHAGVKVCTACPILQSDD